MSDEISYLLCSNCFQDHGLKYDAKTVGEESEQECPNCTSTGGRKLTRDALLHLSQLFFVFGSNLKTEYGSAPAIQFNDYQYNDGDITFPRPLMTDKKLLEETLKVGFFHYGPRLWMVGEVEPLNDMLVPETRGQVIERILKEYPSRVLSPDQLFYRLRVNPDNETDGAQYDSPPETVAAQGRLNADGVPIMYGSQDLEVCIHECRVLVSDELFVATLKPTRDLRVLDLTTVLEEEHVTEFESLDIAVHFLFAAGEHSYEIARDIAVAAKETGFDGVLYPSYFTNVRLGMPPNQTSYGISHRRFPQAKGFIESTTIPNIALFGRPIAEGKVEVECINRLLLRRIQYDAHFGPVGY